MLLISGSDSGAAPAYVVLHGLFELPPCKFNCDCIERMMILQRGYYFLCQMSARAYQSIFHCVLLQEHVSCRRRQGASNYVERHLHLHTFSAFHIRTMGNTLYGGIVIAIPNAHTSDDANNSLSLRFLLWYKIHTLLYMQTSFCIIMWSWMLLAVFGGSYDPIQRSMG